MNVGVAAEIKADERRVALRPAGAREFTRRGHRVVVERGSGEGTGFPAEACAAAGAETGVDDVFDVTDLILKVREQQSEEVTARVLAARALTYLHLAEALAADPLCHRGPIIVDGQVVHDVIHAAVDSARASV